MKIKYLFAKHKVSVTLILILLLLLVVSDLRPNIWLPKHGQVVDKETGAPIEGVHVIANWEGYALIGARSDCHHLDAAVTDKKAMFRIPIYFEGVDLLKESERTLGFYKRGYVDARYSSNEWLNDGKIWYLKKEVQNNEARIKELENMLDVSRCG